MSVILENAVGREYVDLVMHLTNDSKIEPIFFLTKKIFIRIIGEILEIIRYENHQYLPSIYIL